MKKKIFLAILMFLLCITKVNASETLKMIENGVYYVRDGGDEGYKSGMFYTFTLNNKITYCVEPGSHINTDIYNTSNSSLNDLLGDELAKKIELIGYYGYEYIPGNHKTVKYLMATQALIWENISHSKVEFYTEMNRKGEYIDISKERNEIMRLVNNYYNKPDFNTNLYYNHEYILKSDNFNLLDYDAINYSKSKVWVNQNELHVNTLNLGDNKVVFQRKKYDSKTTLIYAPNDNTSQKLAVLRFYDKTLHEVNFNVRIGKLHLQKVDDLNNSIKSKVKFDIVNYDTNESLCENNVCETNELGELYLEIPNFGKYEIRELDQELTGYLWNSEPLIIEVNPDNMNSFDEEKGNIYEVKFMNKRVLGKVDIYKKGEDLIYKDDNYYYGEKNLEGIEYSLYNNEDIYINDVLVYPKDTLIKKVYTDNNGYTSIDNLELDYEYYLVETKTLDNYVKDNNKYYFKINYIDNKTEVITKTFNFKNNLKKGILIIKKIDSLTKNGISDTMFGLYSLDNNLIKKVISDKKGEIIINDLYIGNYYIKELKANDNYLLNDNSYSFEIKNNEESNLVIENDKIIIVVPKTDKNNYTLYILGTINILLGMGLIIWKKRYI